MSQPRTPATNTGHGIVWARPDGLRDPRCGGPALCAQCRDDVAILAEFNDAAPDPPPLLRLPQPELDCAQDLARLFHRTYERIAPAYGHGTGETWEATPGTARAALVDTMAEMELALRPGRAVLEVRAGQTVLLCVGPDAPLGAAAALRDQVARWLPGNTVVVVCGVTTAITTPDPLQEPADAH